jgi:hypothetical protein
MSTHTELDTPLRKPTLVPDATTEELSPCMASEELEQRGYLVNGVLEGDPFGKYEKFTVGALIPPSAPSAAAPIPVSTSRLFTATGPIVDQSGRTVSAQARVRCASAFASCHTVAQVDECERDRLSGDGGVR